VKGGRPTTAFHAILCDIVDEKLIDFMMSIEDVEMLELISKLSSDRRRAGSFHPRNAVSFATVL
jgi:hypothetical protein